MEWLGITATIFVLLSFLAKKENNIRKINIIGALIFVIYGYTIGSASTCILNTALIIIHTIYLGKDVKNEQDSKNE